MWHDRTCYMNSTTKHQPHNAFVQFSQLQTKRKRNGNFMWQTNKNNNKKNCFSLKKKAKSRNQSVKTNGKIKIICASVTALLA